MKASEDTFPKSTKNRLTMIPLRDIVVFPHMVLPFFVGRKKSIRAVEDAMVNGRIIFLTTQKDKEASEPGESDICRVGTVARILQMLKLPDGTVRLLVEGYERAHIVRYSEQKNLFRVHVKPIKEKTELTQEIVALIRSVKSEFYTFAAIYKKIPADVITKIEKISVPDILIDTICAHVPMKVENKIELLTETDQQKRLEHCAFTLASERNLVELEQKIQHRIKKRIEKTQKNFFLNEQLKEIQRELGTEHDDPAGVRELEGKLKEKGLPDEVFARCRKELKRLSRLQPMSPESGVIRTYLEWIADVPWKEMTEDNRDIESARRILDEDHYDVKNVKERILDFIAVCVFMEKIKGPILCFVGPPGTGKTSLGRSVARALNRNFVRISLGGVRDEAEIRGHRKTYIGALPGKIIQSMKKAGTKNPVFLLDEVDKMSSDYRGDPAAALLEVLDPEQNNTFMDHYLEVQYDLSHVLFITTANSVHNIPYALMDRMEVIHISGYSEYEKQKIAEEFLVPKQLRENGLEWADIRFHKTALLAIIRNYTMESGVRNLEREVANIIRNIARNAVKKGIHLHEDKHKEVFRVRVTQKNLQRYCGREKYRENLFLQDNKPGLAYGLAWTEKGGLLLPVEVALLAGKGDFMLTGSLGDVMKESARAAFSFLRAHADVFKIENDAFKKKDIHIHVPEGSIPKDGPSAGITVTAALLSAMKGVPVKKGYAMTGEITLTGRMLPIGGLKEKILAAHRNKMTHILLPGDNRKDIDELPKEVTSSLTFLFTDSVAEGLFHLFDGF
jgi:ATP-dependent Lon protease